VSWGISSSSGLCIMLSQATGSGIHVASDGFLIKRYEFCYAKQQKSNGERNRAMDFGRKRMVAKKQLIGSTIFPIPSAVVRRNVILRLGLSLEILARDLERS